MAKRNGKKRDRSKELTQKRLKRQKISHQRAKRKLYAEKFNPWVQDSIPEDEHILNFDSHPNIALAAFRLMLGIPGDPRTPQNLSFDYSP